MQGISRCPIESLHLSLKLRERRKNDGEVRKIFRTDRGYAEKLFAKKLKNLFSSDLKIIPLSNSEIYNT
ncbi:MAG TPA: hypothetical protein P5239_02195 [Victivallales bacterium]|nr:hypothetical protein [Victivallales bacterium]